MPRRLPLSCPCARLGINTGGCALALALAPRPLCAGGRLSVCSPAGNGSSQPFLWTKVALLCLSESVGWPRVLSAGGSGGLGRGMRPLCGFACFPSPPSPAAPAQLLRSTAHTSSTIRCPVPNRRRRRSMTSSALSVIGWAAPAGRPLSPVARKLTLP